MFSPYCDSLHTWETAGTRAVQRRKPSVIQMTLNLSDLISCIKIGFVCIHCTYLYIQEIWPSFTFRKEGRLGWGTEEVVLGVGELSFKKIKVMQKVIYPKDWQAKRRPQNKRAGWGVEKCLSGRDGGMGGWLGTKEDVWRAGKEIAWNKSFHLFWSWG